MAQTGYTPIQIYSSSTASAAPAAGSLTNSSLGSELAINITDGKLFYKDNANAVQVIGWKTTPTTAGGTGLTSYTAGDLLYYATGTTLTKLGIGAANQILKSTGTAPAWESVSNLAVTSISFGTTGLTPAAATQGAVTVAGTLVAGNGGTGLSSYTIGDLIYASGTTTLAKLADVATGNALISGGVGVAPSWGKIGLTTHVSGVLPVANGGTNASSASITAFNNITGYTATGATGTTSTNLVFSTSPTITTPTLAGNVTMSTGNLIVGTSGKGIDFSATAHPAGMQSELLDDYEWGTFTPTIVGTTTAGTATYAFQLGRYTKVGNRVFFQLYVDWSGHTGTGSMRVGGLPYTSLASSLSGYSPVAIGYADSIATSASTVLNGYVLNNSTQIYLGELKVAGGTYLSALIDTSAGLGVSGHYEVA